MGRQARSPKRPRAFSSGSETARQTNGRAEKSSGAKIRARAISWVRAKNPIFKFVVVFGILMALFYVVTLLPLFKKTFFPGYLRFNAEISNAILKMLGQHSAVSGTSISSPLFAIDIRRGCDAVEPTALFAAAVLAFPAPFVRKIPGILVGALLLAVINVVRIVSLFLIGRYYPKAFDLMHGDVWQAVFILLAIILWAFWIQWASRSRPPAVNVPQ